MNAIGSCIKELRVGEPLNHGRLTLFPLFATGKEDDLDIATLEEALESGDLKIDELNESGRVPEIHAENSGSRPVLIAEGEEVIGAKQNRCLNVTVLLESRKETVIPVTCVEQGRWRYERRKFSSGSFLSPSLRSKKIASVSRSLDELGSFSSDQAGMWRVIKEKLSSQKVRSSSDAYQDMVRQRRESLDSYRKKVEQLPEDAKGVVVAVGDEVRGLEVFARPRIFRRLAKRLIDGYALDALEVAGEDEAQPKVSEVEAFLEKVEKHEMSERPSVSLGTDVRIDTRELAGCGLVHEDRLLHLSVLSAETKPVTDKGKARSSPRRTQFA